MQRTSEEKAALVARVRGFMGRRGVRRSGEQRPARAGPPVPPGGTVDEHELDRIGEEERQADGG